MLYTSKAVGEWLGITDRQVRNLRDQGVLSEVRPGVFDMKVCVRQYLNFKIGNKDDQARLVAARAEREETRGKIEKMRMEEAQGDLHRTEDVERALKTIFANFKNRLEAIPTKGKYHGPADRPGGSPRHSAKSSAGSTCGIE